MFTDRASHSEVSVLRTWDAFAEAIGSRRRRYQSAGLKDPSLKDLEGRHEADRALAERARERVFANDATFGEKADATGVWTVMKAKTKLGMGMGRRRRRGEGGRKTTRQKRKSRGQ